MKKIVYSIDGRGYYKGRVILNEGDLCPKSENKFLIPANCIEEAPVPPKEGYNRRYINGAWKHEKVVSNASTKIDDTLEDRKLKAIRKRNALLRDSDWSQLADAPLSVTEKKKYKEYRSKLRDLPLDENFPDVTFPVI